MNTHGWHKAFGCVFIILVVRLKGLTGREMAFGKMFEWDQ